VVLSCVAVAVLVWSHVDQGRPHGGSRLAGLLGEGNGASRNIHSGSGGPARVIDLTPGPPRPLTPQPSQPPTYQPQPQPQPQPRRRHHREARQPNPPNPPNPPYSPQPQPQPQPQPHPTRRHASPPRH
jgi:hypothetical protein